jgi:hypothetical protein
VNECKPLFAGYATHYGYTCNFFLYSGEPMPWFLVKGLTLVHFSAQLEPCLTPENTLHALNTPLSRATQPLHAHPIPCKALKLS